MEKLFPSNKITTQKRNIHFGALKSDILTDLAGSVTHLFYHIQVPKADIILKKRFRSVNIMENSC